MVLQLMEKNIFRNGLTFSFPPLLRGRGLFVPLSILFVTGKYTFLCQWRTLLYNWSMYLSWVVGNEWYAIVPLAESDAKTVVRTEMTFNIVHAWWDLRCCETLSVDKNILRLLAATFQTPFMVVFQADMTWWDFK